MKSKTSEIQKIQNYAKNKAQLTLKVNLIAGLLFSFNPSYSVQAQKADDNKEIDKLAIQTINEDYHSFLLDSSILEEAEEITSLDDTHFVNEQEEVNALRHKLLEILTQADYSDIVEQLKEEDLTIGEFKQLLNTLMEELAQTEASDVEDSNSTVQPEDEAELEDILDEETADEDADITPDSTPVEKPEEKPEERLEDSKETPSTPAVSFKVEPFSHAETTQNKAASNKLTTYIVKAGDTLNKIAQEFKTTVQEIAILNNLDNINHIRVGQKLTIYDLEGNLEELAKPHSKTEFIEILGEYATTVAKEHNLYASVMIAQAALETGFGQSALSAVPNHNLYGMKGNYHGNSVLMTTKEYSASKGWYTIQANFKKYPSYLESLLDHAAYIRRGPSWSPNYYAGVWLENTTSYRDATAALQGRYATDPSYASKLNAIIERYNLTRFDLTEGTPEIPPVADGGNNKPVGPSTDDKKPNPGPTINYTVKRGDTLSHIARNYQMTVRELKELNNLASDLILVGQQLKVKEIVTPPVKPTPEPEPKPEAKPPVTQSQIYTVKRGDTLSKIARENKMTVSELKQINNLKSDLIFVNQKLKLKATVETVKPTNQKYTVKRGDTLYQIALKNKTTVKAIKEKNNLRSDLIFVGQQLNL